MGHASNIVTCAGPDSPHAFDLVPLLARNGSLDARCPVCSGHGQWNREIDLVSFRCVREICDRCLGAGWVETGDDPLRVVDIVLTAQGHPIWVTNLVPRGDIPEHERKRDPMIMPDPPKPAAG
jgi:hypothetical protein